MKITIEVPNTEAKKVKNWFNDLPNSIRTKKASNTKKIARKINLSLLTVHDDDDDPDPWSVSCHVSNVWIEDVQDPIEVGDIVRNTKSGNWGRVKTVYYTHDSDSATIVASKETAAELGIVAFNSPLSELEILI